MRAETAALMSVLVMEGWEVRFLPERLRIDHLGQAEAVRVTTSVTVTAELDGVAVSARGATPELAMDALAVVAHRRVADLQQRVAQLAAYLRDAQP